MDFLFDLMYVDWLQLEGEIPKIALTIGTEVVLCVVTGVM